MNKMIWKGKKRRDIRYFTVCALLASLALGLACMMLIYGKIIYSPNEILKIYMGEDLGKANYTILRLRTPRLISGFFAGAGLGMSGYVFQTILRNPLASPDIIGVSTSTSAAAIFCIAILGLEGFLVPVIALIAGLLVSIFVYMLATYGGFSHTRMILIGIGVQAIVSAFISWILSKTSEYDLQNSFRWLSGSLNNAEMTESVYLAVVVCIGAVVLYILRNHLIAIELGDEYAMTLGANPAVIYKLLIATAVLMVAFTTAVTGPVASVSFLSGPLAIRMAGKSKSGILPSALTGIILVLLGDMIGQYAFDTRYPVGLVTGFIGSVYLIYLIIIISRKR